MTSISQNLKEPFADLLLSVADDKFILGHRNSDWTGLAPILEEDIAFSSLAQDEIAHAKALYELIGGLLGRSADELAFGRALEAYRCATIVELPDAFDWATAICRQFLCNRFDALRLARLARSTHKPLADLAGRLAAEQRIHVEHADSWLVRLGAGTEDSRRRMQQALDALAPKAPMLFEPVEGQERLESAGLYPPAAKDMFGEWSESIAAVTGKAELRLTLQPPATKTNGGRRGRHSEHLAELLDEMCEVYRLEPNAAW